MNKEKVIVGISAIAHYLPSLVRTSTDVEIMINKDLRPKLTIGSIERSTGIITRRISTEIEYNSTLAIRACQLLFEKEKIDPATIDLLIFASTGQDVLEPATVHIVQAEIGTNCQQVMDVKNACNSFLNALEIAVAFVEAGKYKSVLIATGEVPSKAAKYDIKSRDEFKKYRAGFTFGDAGTAVLVNSRAKIAAVLDSYFFSESDNWSVAMLKGGGSRYLNDPNAYSFEGDPQALIKPFFVHIKRLVVGFLERNKITLDDIDHVFMHQVAEVFITTICNGLDLPRSKIQVTIKEYGNVAAASIPLGIDLMLNNKTPKPGSLGLCMGFAGGISIGLTLIRFN